MPDLEKIAGAALDGLQLMRMHAIPGEAVKAMHAVGGRLPKISELTRFGIAGYWPLGRQRNLIALTEENFVVLPDETVLFTSPDFSPIRTPEQFETVARLPGDTEYEISEELAARLQGIAEEDKTKPGDQQRVHILERTRNGRVNDLSLFGPLGLVADGWAKEARFQFPYGGADGAKYQVMFLRYLHHIEVTFEVPEKQGKPFAQPVWVSSDPRRLYFGHAGLTKSPCTVHGVRPAEGETRRFEDTRAAKQLTEWYAAETAEPLSVPDIPPLPQRPMH